MQFSYQCIEHTVHRLIPSRYPPVLPFDWASSPEELEQIAALESLTNDRLLTECGEISLVPSKDWISGPGSTPLMAAFTHPAPSRFTDGTYGVYYAGDSLKTAIAETVFHRERFLSASNEPACLIQMREYIAKVKEKLVSVSEKSLAHVLHPDISQYPVSQDFGRQLKVAQEWGVYYPSVRATGQYCVAIFRAPALTIPHQAAHLDYIWDGQSICEVRKASVIA